MCGSQPIIGFFCSRSMINQHAENKVTIVCLAQIDRSVPQPLHLRLRGKSWKSGWKDCNSQRMRMPLDV